MHTNTHKTCLRSSSTDSECSVRMYWKGRVQLRRRRRPAGATRARPRPHQPAVEVALSRGTNRHRDRRFGCTRKLDWHLVAQTGRRAQPVHVLDMSYLIFSELRWIPSVWGQCRQCGYGKVGLYLPVEWPDSCERCHRHRQDSLNSPSLTEGSQRIQTNDFLRSPAKAWRSCKRHPFFSFSSSPHSGPIFWIQWIPRGS